MARRQVISCPWQDEQGNVLALGSIVFEASGDALVTGTGELCAGIKGSLNLDSNGQVAVSPAQYMWPTDQMSPSNITYTVWVYSANGELAWGPNYGLTVPSGAGSFNLCTWVPNQIGSSSGAAAGSLTLQTNGVNNALQNLLNLESTDSSITITDEGNGSVNLQAASSRPALPFFSAWYSGFTTLQCGVSGAENVALGFLFINDSVTFSNMALSVTAGNTGGDISDVGIYALSSGGTVGTLVASIGGTNTTSTGVINFAVSQGTVTLPAGRYLVASASKLGSGMTFSVAEVNAIDYEYTTAGVAVSGVLPATLILTQSALVVVPSNYDNYLSPLIRLN